MRVSALVTVGSAAPVPSLVPALGDYSGFDVKLVDRVPDVACCDWSHLVFRAAYAPDQWAVVPENLWGEEPVATLALRQVSLEQIRGLRRYERPVAWCLPAFSFEDAWFQIMFHVSVL